MRGRHKRHMMHGSHHKHGGHHPPHIHKAKGGGVNDEEGTTDEVPSLVAGNKNVVAAAKNKKSIGEVPEIYMKGGLGMTRLDRKRRSGGSDAASLVKK